jgi:3-oxoacyl-[acyl-carrier protein] reductase
MALSTETIIPRNGMEYGISGRNALVTGAGGRLGSTDCEKLAQEGVDVYALDVDEEAVTTAAEEINEGDQPGEVRPVVCDLTDRDDVESTVQSIVDEAGAIDILVNNAAMVDARSKFEDYDEDLWDRDVAVNLDGTYNITREVYPLMLQQEWGRIVNMTSIAGWLGGFGQASYSATKAALIGFGKTLALEGAQSNVTANVIAPSVVYDGMADMSPDEIEEFDEYMARIVRMIPMRRAGRNAEVADLVVFLSSENASYITGQVIGATGGADLFTF